MSPDAQEGVLLSHPDIMGAVMFGAGKPECGVIIEAMPAAQKMLSDAASVEAFKTEIR